MSVEDAINYSPSEDEDYYALLSCDESSTVEQITAEYKVLALQYHPDKNDGDKEAEKKFQQLKYAKEVLCDPEKRTNYDKWRNSGIKISYKQWLGMKEHVQQTMHWSTPKTKDRMLPDTTEEAGGSPAHLKGHPTNAHRRASEGGATNLYYRSGHDVPFYQESNEVVNRALCVPAELNKEQWFTIEKDFKEKWNFPHCIGAIDGKHVVIQCPNKAGSMYFNYKNSHSLVLLAMCNANYIFTFVDIGAYGRRSDGGIFKDSLLGQKLEGNKMNIPNSTPISDVRATPLPYCIVGDEAFPLKTYLLRPYPGKQSTELPKRIFNYRLSRARRVIENTFGILVAKWRIFRKPIIASDSNVVKMVKATVVLHNWLRQHDLDNSPEVSYVSEELFNQEHCYDSLINSTRRNEEHGRLIDINRMGSNNATHTAIQIREEFTSYFNNEGAVNWQYDHL